RFGVLPVKAFAAVVAILLAAPVSAATISISCGAVGQELELCREGAEAWAEESGHEVRIVSTPNSTTDRLALYPQMLAAGAGDIDVYQIDVVWPGILAPHLIDLAPFSDGAEAAHLPAVVANNTVDGELKAMPWFTDAGLLFYRRDLLEKHGEQVPETWEELAATAARVVEAERAEGDDALRGFVFQGKAYEGLTTNALEWIASHGGGTIVDDAGAITIDNPAAAEALAEAASWVGTIAPEGVLAYTEEEARGVFQSGRAVFMRNWPYAWALAQAGESPVRARVGVAALPKGGPEGTHVGTLGGYQLAVSRYSESPEIAADLVMHLTGEEEQKRRAIAGAFNPTIAALYEDADVLAAVPFLASLRETVTNAVARPSGVTGEDYNKVSAAFWGTVHEVLAGQAEPEPALARLARDLARIRRDGW
ncbi:MAG TPA: ABC transporter substrate-binding protein, partial [Thermohalobaculum sp.]|nr:ABC transporter substrate-binding protein [Thermohalobaculum sp.]